MTHGPNNPSSATDVYSISAGWLALGPRMSHVAAIPVFRGERPNNGRVTRARLVLSTTRRRDGPLIHTTPGKTRGQKSCVTTTYSRVYLRPFFWARTHAVSARFTHARFIDLAAQRQYPRAIEELRRKNAITALLLRIQLTRPKRIGGLLRSDCRIGAGTSSSSRIPGARKSPRFSTSSSRGDEHVL